MTSGETKTVPVSSIWVDRAKRQRRDITQEEIEELAQSISRVGLIHFPVIQRSGELRVGERRLLAVKHLGWTDLPVQYVEDMDESELQLLELEENTRRRDIPWQDECRAVKQYHELKQSDTPTWTLDQTAEALGLSSAGVDKRMSVARELDAGNTRVLDAPKFSTALNIVTRENSRKRASELETLTNGDTPAPELEVPILNEDFHTWVEPYDGPKFNLIHCDFPYGINADKHDQGAGASHGGYSDNKSVYDDLIWRLDRAMFNVVDESAHLIFWFSMDYYEWTRDALGAMGWRLDKRPLIWYKSDGTSILPDPNRGPRWCYETAFFGSRGDRKIVQAVNNLCSHPATKEWHMSEKPVGMLTHFMRMICDEYSTIFDPTAGSGNVLIAGSGLGARRVLGLERDKEFYDRACQNWRQTQAGDGEGSDA